MSSHKKRRELNRSTAEHTGARIRAELAQGVVNFENLMEHAMGVRIKELERERDAFYMEYRMKCDEETKALQADNERLREALELIAGTDPVEAALDPQRAVRVARNALAKVRKP